MTQKKFPTGGRTDIASAWRNMVEAAGEPTTRIAGLKNRLAEERREPAKIDGRSLRKTGRTLQVNVRMKQGTKASIERIASSRNWLIGEVIEHAVAALEAQIGDVELNSAQKKT